MRWERTELRWPREFGRTQASTVDGVVFVFWGWALSQRRIAVSTLIEPPIFTQVPVASTM